MLACNDMARLKGTREERRLTFKGRVSAYCVCVSVNVRGGHRLSDMRLGAFGWFLDLVGRCVKYGWKGVGFVVC